MRNWLGHDIDFFNEESHQSSKSMFDVIPSSELEFDEDGLSWYLQYGVSYGGRTPFKHLRFTEASTWYDGAELKVGAPASEIIQSGKQTTPAEVFELMRHYFRINFDTNVVLPLSGGLDSRLMAGLLAESQIPVECFTYGLSWNSTKSFEVQYAKDVANTLHFDWSEIRIDSAFDHLNQWYRMFGPYVHAHGMYQLDFYSKISQETNTKTVLSGIASGFLAGEPSPVHITDWTELLSLMNTSTGIPSLAFKKKKTPPFFLEKIYQDNKAHINHKPTQDLIRTQLRMPLLRYLTMVPSAYGLAAQSPYLDSSIALAMLRLPENERLSRKWMHAYFDERNISPERRIDPWFQNVLDLKQLLNSETLRIEIDLFDKYIDGGYLQKINHRLASIKGIERVFWRTSNLRYLNRISRKLLGDKEWRTAYSVFCILYPLQRILLDTKRDM